MDDIAPTILYAMGLPVPRDMDGKVLTAMFDQRYLDANPIIWEEVSASEEVKARELSDEESKIVEERLKALGYLSRVSDDRLDSLTLQGKIGD